MSQKYHKAGSSNFFQRSPFGNFVFRISDFLEPANISSHHELVIKTRRHIYDELFLKKKFTMEVNNLCEKFKNVTLVSDSGSSNFSIVSLFEWEI